MKKHSFVCPVGVEKNYLYSILPKHSQFRGNTSELTHHCDDGHSTIILLNTYYGGYARQEYDIVTGVTSINYIYNVITPKYIQKKMEALVAYLHHCGVDRTNNVLDCLVIKCKDYEIGLMDFCIDIKQTKEYEGFAFKNNLHNIDALRELREVMKAVKKVFRYNAVEDIANTYRISLSGISPNQFFNLKQSPHECKN
tara:strand:- start:1284 stop:1874 length:591 start_codon:yes stop_codon:yes gene_type:complete